MQPFLFVSFTLVSLFFSGYSLPSPRVLSQIKSEKTHGKLRHYNESKPNSTAGSESGTDRIVDDKLTNLKAITPDKTADNLNSSSLTSYNSDDDILQSGISQNERESKIGPNRKTGAEISKRYAEGLSGSDRVPKNGSSVLLSSDAKPTDKSASKKNKTKIKKLIKPMAGPKANKKVDPISVVSAKVSGTSKTDKPKPKDSETDKPRPKESETDKTKPKDSEADKPKLHDLETDKPEPKDSETDKPRPKESKADKPKPKESETDKPKPKESETDKPEPKESVADKPKPKDSDAEKPRLKDSEADKPKPKDSEADKPKPKEPETDKPGPKESDADKPKPKDSDADKPRLKDSERDRPVSETDTLKSNGLKTEKLILNSSDSATVYAGEELKTSYKKSMSDSKDESDARTTPVKSSSVAAVTKLTKTSSVNAKPVVKKPKIDLSSSYSKPLVDKKAFFDDELPSNQDKDEPMSQPPAASKGGSKPDEAYPVERNHNSRLGGSKNSDRKMQATLAGKSQEDAGSNRFIVFFIAAVLTSGLLYVLYHKKQKIMACVIEGRRSGRGASERRRSGSRRTSLGSSGSARPVDEKPLLSSSETKPESVQNFIY